MCTPVPDAEDHSSGYSTKKMTNKQETVPALLFVAVSSDHLRNIRYFNF